MNKRQFLRAALASPALALSSPAPAKERLTNWSGNLTYATDRVDEASSLDRIRAVIKANSKLKVLGSRHCFNTIADSRHRLLSLKPMKDISLNSAAKTVSVQPGVTYGQLGPYLDERGFALHNLASLPHISVAGACTTATHGSGETNGNLASAVSAIEFLNAEGDLVKLAQSDGEPFHAAVVGLGAIGVLTSLTLNIQPAYKVRQYVYQDLPLAQMKNHFDAIQASAYSVSLFTDWQNSNIREVWIKARAPFAAPQEFFEAKLATHNLHPISEVSPENCTEQLGVPGPWYERLPHFKMGFTPSAGKELQSEYLIPRRNAVDAILAIERLRDRITPHLLISEIRTIAADGLWMSTAYQQPSVAIHFTWKPDWPAVKALLPAIEQELAPYAARPHWGKLFTIKPADLHSRYEKLPAFIHFARQHDPQGKFRNSFLDQNIFGA